MELPELIMKRNAIGSLTVIDGADCTEDNVAIALAIYFEKHPDKPENAPIDQELGWSKWAMDKTNDVLDRIVRHLTTAST